MASNVSFTKIIVTICIAALFAASVILVPVGLHLAMLPCLFLEFLGYFAFVTGLASSVCFLRIIRKFLFR